MWIFFLLLLNLRDSRRAVLFNKRSISGRDVQMDSREFDVIGKKVLGKNKSLTIDFLHLRLTSRWEKKKIGFTITRTPVVFCHEGITIHVDLTITDKCPVCIWSRMLDDRGNYSEYAF